MQQLSCEMCGSTDIVKQDNIYICQSCGSKYSVDEINKLSAFIKSINDKIAVQGGSPNVSSLLKRTKIFLEEEDWDSAESYCEKVLDIDPENAQAYVYKIMLDEEISEQEKLSSCDFPFNDDENFRMAVRYGSEQLKKQLMGYNQAIVERNNSNAYSNACSKLECSKTEQDFLSAAAMFQSIKDYRDSNFKSEQCKEFAENARIENIYLRACSLFENSKSEKEYLSAAEMFGTIEVYKDSKFKLEQCLEQAKIKKTETTYSKACNILEHSKTQNNFLSAAELFKGIKDYKDASVKMAQCLELAENANTNIIYTDALVLISSDNIKTISDGISKLESIVNYKDASEQIIIAKRKINELKEKEKQAKVLDKKRNSKILFRSVIIIALLAFVLSIVFFVIIPSYQGSKYQTALQLSKDGKSLQAAQMLESITNNKDAENLLKKLCVTNAAFISAKGEHALALKSDGTVNENYSDMYGGKSDVADWNNIIAISANYNTKIGLKSDGTVIATGDFNVLSWKNIIAIASGGDHVVGLKSDGTVIATGSDHDAQCEVSNWSNIVAISADNGITVGLKADGTVVATGDNSRGACNVSNWNNIVAISSDSMYTMGLLSDGTVVLTNASISGWKNIVAISAGVNYIVGLKADGTVVLTKNNSIGQINNDDWKNIVAISAGVNYIMGLKADGTVITTDNCVSNWTNIGYVKK